MLLTHPVANYSAAPPAAWPPPVISSASSPPSPPPSARPRSSLLRNSAVLAAVASLLFAYYSSSSSAASGCYESVIAPHEDELLDLIGRTRLTSDDLIALYSTCMRRHTLGLLTLEQFARHCAEQVDQARHRRREQRRRRKELRRQSEQDSEQHQHAVEQQGETKEPTQAGDGNDMGSYWDEQEESEEKDAVELLAGGVVDEQREKQLRDSMRRASFSWWELLALYRTAQPVTGQYHDIRQLMVGVAQLAYDHEPWQTVHERRMRQQGKDGQQSQTGGGGSALSRSRRLMLCYQPWKKLEVAWRVSQAAGAGDTMTYVEVRRLVERMIGTGHFTAASLVRGVSQSWWRPQYVHMDAEAVTYLIFQQLHTDARWAGQPSRADIEQDVFVLQGAEIHAAAPPALPQQTDFEERLTDAPNPHSASFLHRFVPSARYTLIQPTSHTSVTRTPTIPPSSSLTYSQLLNACRSLSHRGHLQLWYGVARDAASGERAGPIKRRRMAVQERLKYIANRLLTMHDTQSTAHWLP